MLIYGIINKQTNRFVYVGKTIRKLKSRWKQHLRDATRHVDYPLYRAMRKYGPDNFAVEELESGFSSDQDLNAAEISFILKHDTLTTGQGYNLMLGHGGGRHSEESKRKLSVKAKENGFGRWERRPEHNEANRVKGIKQHADPRKRIKFLIANGSERFFVYKAIQLRRRNNQQSSIYCMGDFVGSFFDTVSCSKHLGISHQHIGSCLSGKRSQHSGYLFIKPRNLLSIGASHV